MNLRILKVGIVLLSLSLVAIATGCATGSRTKFHVQAPVSPIPAAKSLDYLLEHGYSLQSRNGWIEQNVIRINASYYEFEADLQKSRSTLGIGTSTAALLFNVASSLTLSAGVKANYVAANSLATGTNQIVTREQFMEQTVSTLIAAMRGRRATAFAFIRIGMSKPEGEYTLSEAHRDLLDYASAGTLQEGMKFVLDTTEKASDASEEKASNEIERAVAYTDEERQLTYCISKSLQALRDDDLPRLRQLASDLKITTQAKDTTDILINKVSDQQDNSPAKYQRDLYALMEKRDLLLKTCPRY